MTTELLADPGHSRSDLALLKMAIQKGWQIPEQLLDALPKVAGTMALNGTPRERIAAMKVLLAMKAQNEENQRRGTPIEHRHVHELGPITEANLAEHRARLLAELDCTGNDA